MIYLNPVSRDDFAANPVSRRYLNPVSCDNFGANRVSRIPYPADKKGLIPYPAKPHHYILKSSNIENK